jgi:hypothetical protein
VTKGEYRVGIDFNPSGSEEVDVIKRLAADLIDDIEGIPVNNIPEIGRLKALAQTAIEEGAMWAVKACTKKPMEEKAAAEPSYQELVEEPKEE